MVQPSLPAPVQPTNSNAYIGTQNPGYWSLTLDDSQNVFSYRPITYAPTPNPAVQGSFQNIDGILNFGQVKGSSTGMAVEAPSRVAVMRPGDNTTAPVSSVVQSGCFAITGIIRFTFTTVPAAQQSPGAQTTYIAYGTIAVGTSADGKSWQFGGLSEYQLTEIPGGTVAGTPASPAIPDPLSFTGTCASTNGQAVITTTNPAYAVSPTYRFNSAGYFIRDTSPSTAPPQDGSYASWIGVAMPASPLSASDIASGNYRGFVYEPNTPSTNVVTQPIALTATLGVGGSLSGGIYPNDTLTSAVSAQYTIALGNQDGTLNGVFPTATLTMPDPNFICALVAQSTSGTVKSGFDVNGNPICTTGGVAVVGKPEDKYVLYFTALDGTAGTSLEPNAYTLQMYLYQQ
ncbi:MAG: hypothetical protein WBX22_19620 [Silvibacterium sp.]